MSKRDLAQALAEGKLAGAAVDVASKEPISPDNPLLCTTRSVISPHIACASREARLRLIRTTAENIRAYLAGRPTKVVNPR